jgi:hypothetical protein
MGQSFPVPAEVRQPDSSPERQEQTLHQMKAWLRLLDMAITAPMIRDALKQQELPGETAESLLRYHIFKSSRLDADRDKTDFLGTHLLRNPGPTSRRLPAASAFDPSGEAYSYVFSQKQAQEFELEIQQVLAEMIEPLPGEHEQLLREFQYLHQEANEFRTFNELMDSGILQRVRELKSHFGQSFYHPQVLASSAVYNMFFGKRFDELFREATNQIKAFAAKVQQDGGSIMSRVDGDVTVKNLAEVEENKILTEEYGRAREDFRQISKFKKAVDSRRSARAAAVHTPPPRPAPASAAAPTRSALPPTPTGVQSLAEAPGRSFITNALEETKIRGAIDSIRNFVHAADPAMASVVPMRNGNIMLTPVETEVFRAGYHTEKSFRADYVNSMCYMVALHYRMEQEMQEYKAKRDSSYLWKPHADSLTYMLTASRQALDNSGHVSVVAEQRGLTEKVKAMNATQDKLRGQINVVAELLQS